jgi:hypothetical protein
MTVNGGQTLTVINLSFSRYRTFHLAEPWLTCAMRRSNIAGSVSSVVLYDGEATVSFGDRMCAVPIRALWEHPV